ncbi:hypothetical protein LTR53_005881 [Teratosphaeriaceae sp. CCFEE 6253]|nr:hypothetical protein LTR53_005881 [Teratosphaeriaceae sp. CCFEE 6253]
MDSSRRSSFEGCIDPKWLTMQEPLVQAGSWTEDAQDETMMAHQAASVDVMELDELPDTRDWDLRFGSRLHEEEEVVAPEQHTQPSVYRPQTPPNVPLRPRAQPLQSQPSQRPALQLATSDAHLKPNNPAYTQPAPRSAPDIRVHGPDPFPPTQYPSSALTAQHNPRRRAVSHAMPMLHQMQTAPAGPVPLSDGLLSPIMAEYLKADYPIPLGHLSGAAKSPTSPHSPDRSRHGSRSPSRSRSHSRSSSKASSARSSATGEHPCTHPGCESRFATPANLKHHARYHTPHDQRPYPCDQCAQRFLFRRELDRHKLSKTHRAPQFPCPKCGTLFSRPDHVERHVEHHACPQQQQPPRPATPVTPASSEARRSAPSTTGSSVPVNPLVWGYAGEVPFDDTPGTEYDASPLPDRDAFPSLVSEPYDPAGFDCDPPGVAGSEPWPPSPSPAGVARDHYQYLPEHQLWQS